MMTDNIYKTAFDAGVKAERARCIQIAERQADDSAKASYTYDGGAGSSGYERACADIVSAISAAEGR